MATYTTTDSFKGFKFLAEYQKAYDALEKEGIEMDFENNPDAWTNIAENEDGQQFAIYGEGPITSSAMAICIELPKLKEFKVKFTVTVTQNWETVILAESEEQALDKFNDDIFFSNCDPSDYIDEETDEIELKSIKEIKQ